MAKLLRSYQDFSGGLSEVAVNQMRDNQLVVAQNVVPGQVYGIAKAFGTCVALPRLETGAVVNKLVNFKPVAGEVQILAFTDRELFRLNGSYWVVVDSLLSPVRDWFIQAGKLWWLDGEKLRHYDGTQVVVVDLDMSSPSQADKDVWARVAAASFVEFMDGRWFFARVGSNEVYFSEVGFPNRVKATSILNFDTKNAETITALQVFDQGLLVFKESSIDYLVSGNWETAQGVQRIPLNVTCGTAFADTVQVVENAVLFLGSNGLYRLRLPSLSMVISVENVSEYSLASEIKAFRPVKAFAAVWDGVYYLSLVNSGEQREYRYFLRQKAFFGPFTQDFTCYAVALVDKALYLGCVNGYILRYDEGSFDYFNTASGAPRPVEMVAVTKPFDLTGTLVRDAKVKDLLVAVRQFSFLHSRVSVDITGDYFRAHYDIEFDECGVYDDDDFDHAFFDFSDTVVKDVWINQVFKRAQLTIMASGLGQPLLIYGLSFVFKPKKPKGHREGVRKGVPNYVEA